MGRRPPSAAQLKDYAKLASETIKGARARAARPLLRSLDSAGGKDKAAAPPPEGRRAVMDSAAEEGRRVPLSEVVADCLRRWFQDALKEARNGDASMQVLVGQMYQTGYGVPRNEQKAKSWITKASRYRSSVWKVSDKHPGYNASDSDSDEVKDGQQ